MNHRILYADSKHEKLAFEESIAGAGFELINARCRSFDALPAAELARCDALVVVFLQIGAKEIERMPKLRVLLRHGVGFDNVDLEACGAAGIAVCNIPDYGTTDVADAAIAIMLSFARGTVAFEQALRADLAAGWTHVHNTTARRLRGASFGVIGLGRIGTAAALRAKAFGMDVCFYDPLLPNGAELGVGLARARSPAELYARSDVISIHAPLTPETRGMINRDAVAAMKPGAWVINTARGPICDTVALLAGLESGKLGAVGLDVLPNEPGATTDPLVAAWLANEPWIRGRVILSPHSGFYSPDAMSDQRRKATETVCNYLRDGVLANCVNREYLKTPR